ncbi:MAG: hypothetical protein F6K58_16490 [Symploca sp. SIO2E9]|nr:hypothetical protein [Symploca sp. SIO2E9]
MGLDVIELEESWTSPRLGIRFDFSVEPMQIYRPDDEPFLDYAQVQQHLEQERQRADNAEQKTQQLQQQIEQERQRTELEKLDVASRLLKMGLTTQQAAEALGPHGVTSRLKSIQGVGCGV